MRVEFLLGGLLSLEISILCYLLFLQIANRKKVYQTEREEGPDSHKKKNGTITMGGIVFVLVPLIIYLFIIFIKKDIKIYEILIIITSFLGMSLIGFIDDYLKVVKHNNNGISARIKLLLQVLIASICFISYLNLGISTKLNLFFIELDLKWIYGLLIFFYIVGFSNAANLTDGIDGLCAGVSVIILLALLLIALKQQQLNIALFIVCLITSLLAFLLFNSAKAFMFMGDTGSLALGGVIAALSILLKVELLIVIISGVFVIETLSVIMQVTYFKMTKGKRIFKMSPIHHHFELSGLNEKSIVIMFYIVSVVLAFIGLYLGGIL